MKTNTLLLRYRIGGSLLLIMMSLGLSSAVFALGVGNPLEQPTAWVDCEKFNSVVTKTSFKMNSQAFDELYAGGDGFLDGTPLISDAGPNDTNFNGGRWHLNVLKEGVAADKYANICSVQDLDPDDFVSTEVYFECPLFPIRGRNNQ